MKARTVTTGLLIASTAAGGLMGSLLDRAVVATPAWRKLGPVAWAAYSRHADLGNGQILYPIGYIGLAALAVAAAAAVTADRTASRGTAIPVYLQAAFMVAVMVLTIKAAPVMDSVARLSQATALRRAFGQFTLWGIYLRGAAVILAFGCSVWALAAVSRAPRAPGHGTVPAGPATATSGAPSGPAQDQRRSRAA